MRFLDYQVLSGKDNMVFDEQLLEEAVSAHSGPILRFYGWSEPTISFGRNQDTFITDLPCVKRITGGRSLLHDKELTYCFICSQDFLQNGASVIASYKEISQGLVLGFRELGVELEFPQCKKVSTHHGYCMNLSTGSDLSYRGKKFIGSAQVRKKGYILQHGSILLDYDAQLLEDIFGEKVTDVVSLKEIDPTLCDVSLLCDALKRGFAQNFGIK